MFRLSFRNQNIPDCDALCETIQIDMWDACLICHRHPPYVTPILHMACHSYIHVSLHRLSVTCILHTSHDSYMRVSHDWYMHDINSACRWRTQHTDWGVITQSFECMMPDLMSHHHDAWVDEPSCLPHLMRLSAIPQFIKHHSFDHHSSVHQASQMKRHKWNHFREESHMKLWGITHQITFAKCATDWISVLQCVAVCCSVAVPTRFGCFGKRFAVSCSVLHWNTK